MKTTTTPPTAETTPDALRRAAHKLFAQHGYDGTSVRAITTAARANLGAVTYHFGSKRALYHAVLEEAFGPVSARAAAAAEADAPPLERAAGVVRTMFSMMAERPSVPFLMLQEMAAGRQPPEPAAAAMQRILGALVAAVREGQADGSMRAGDPMLLALSTLSQVMHFTLVRNAMKVMLRIDQSEPETLERVIAHAVVFAQGGLRNTERV